MRYSKYIRQCDLLHRGVRNIFCQNHGTNHVTCFAERGKNRTRHLLPGPLTLQANRMKPPGKPMYTGRAAI